MTICKKLQILKAAYPDHIIAVSPVEILWKDRTSMVVGTLTNQSSIVEKLDHPSLADQLMQAEYPVGRLPDQALHCLIQDPGRVRCQPFYTKMYGDSPEAVMQHLTTIYWMSDVFADQYPLQVTTINDVHKKLTAISSALAELPTTYHKYLVHPPEAYCWREVAATRRLSPHSFGIAIDINVEHAHYWLWQLQKMGKHIQEGMPPPYQNDIPWEIVLIFEKYGFIWGGKWHHYDTMHFEYRPELLMS